MTALHTLLLPILLSSVFVFVASFILHTALPWHKGDYSKMPEEDKFMDAVRPFAIPPGDYMVPRCTDSKEMKSPEFAAKMEKGPIIVLTVIASGPMRMGKSLALWFIYLIVVSFFAAFALCHTLSAGAACRQVFCLAAVTSFLAYSAALWQMSIWYRRSWATTIKATIDGLIYAALTAGTFAWLWPQ